MSLINTKIILTFQCLRCKAIKYDIPATEKFGKGIAENIHHFSKASSNFALNSPMLTHFII